MLYCAGGFDPIVILLTDPLVNVKTDDCEEFVETVTLADDYPALWIARSIDSTIPCYLSGVKVLSKRDNEEMASVSAAITRVSLSVTVANTSRGKAYKRC